MADGQVVLVTTESLRGGLPVRSVYFVAEQDPEKAKAIIGAMMAPNEKVEAWGRLPEAAVKALGLKPSDFKHGGPPLSEIQRRRKLNRIAATPAGALSSPQNPPRAWSP